jgi:hypothetical protein
MAALAVLAACVLSGVAGLKKALPKLDIER